ncbi:MAG: GtrA family protein [Acidimicrobiales bacterium]
MRWWLRRRRLRAGQPPFTTHNDRVYGRRHRAAGEHGSTSDAEGGSATAANMVATATATIPSFELNRRWVWSKRDRRSWGREVVPFWAWAFLELGLSTLAVHSVDAYAQSSGVHHALRTLAAELTTVATTGTLWVVQFFLFDRVLFRKHDAGRAPASVTTSGPAARRSLPRWRRQRCAVSPRVGTRGTGTADPCTTGQSTRGRSGLAGTDGCLGCAHLDVGVVVELSGRPRANSRRRQVVKALRYLGAIVGCGGERRLPAGEADDVGEPTGGCGWSNTLSATFSGTPWLTRQAVRFS